MLAALAVAGVAWWWRNKRRKDGAAAWGGGGGGGGGAVVQAVELHTAVPTMLGEGGNVPLRLAERFLEAIERGLWRPRSNSARALLDQLTDRSPA